MHVDTKGIIVGFWRGERSCTNPRAGDADLWIKIWEELRRLAAGDFVVEVEHVKAHRTREEKKELSQFWKFVAEGKRMSWQKQAMLCEGFTAEARAKTVQQVRKRCTQPCSMQPVFTVLWRNGKTVKNLSQSQKKSEFSLTKRVRTRSIVRSGVQKRKISVYEMWKRQ